VDLIPDVMPLIGWLDDIGLLGFLYWFFITRKAASSHKPENFTETGSSSETRKPEPPLSSPHEILGVEQDASPEEIRKAYRELAGKYHPDKVAHLGDEFREMAEERFKRIQEAYQKLSDKK